MRRGIVSVLLFLDGISDEGQHRAHFRLSAPKAMSDLEMRAVQRACAPGPEVLARIIPCEGVEVANLRGIAAGYSHDVVLR
jgi:hypothetical protein